MKLPKLITKHTATGILLVAVTALVLWPRELLTSIAVAVFAVVVFKVRRYMHNRRQRPVYTQGRLIVYALGKFDARTDELLQVKYGITRRTAEVRCREVDEDEGNTVNVRVLAEEDGDIYREKEIHVMLARYRYERTEWFVAEPPVLAVAAAMPRRTVLGQRILKEVA